jgi:hypothetical protein
MIAATAIIVLGMLTGWIVGLTVHARRVVRWADVGARTAWNAAAGALGGASLLTSLAICVLTRPAPWLAVPILSMTSGAVIGWSACQALDPAPRRHADPRGMQRSRSTRHRRCPFR